ncbi:MAG: hypothetical protein OEM82_03420 [Acidobacteriota bacterium]|nr:hypothetical protein [Acidobacteriota bacterium]MDH3529194.1 hypothetical protein [Acidobacteriota bacterium]
MIKKLLDNIYLVAGLWAAFLAFGLFLFNYSVYPNLKALSKGMDLPEEIFGPTWDYQTVFLDQIGEAGVAQYVQFQWLDFVNALLLGLVLSTTIYLILTKLEAKKFFFVVAAVPLAATLFDFVENGLMIANIGNLPNLDKGLSALYMWMTRIKLLLGTVSFLILLTCIVGFGVTILGKRFKK